MMVTHFLASTYDASSLPIPGINHAVAKGDRECEIPVAGGGFAEAVGRVRKRLAAGGRRIRTLSPLARELFDSRIEEAAKKSTRAVSNDNAPSPRGTVGSKSPSLSWRVSNQPVLAHGSRRSRIGRVFGDIVDTSYRHLWPEGGWVPWSEKPITAR